MTLPEVIDLGYLDDHFVSLYEDLGEEAQEDVDQFIEEALTDRVYELIENAIHQRYQQDR